MDKAIAKVVESFVEALTRVVEQAASERAREVIATSFGLDAKPDKAYGILKTRKKPPRQLCPVPGCKNAAAPIFGMVCKDHKGVAKSLIKKYREARKAKKAA